MYSVLGIGRFPTRTRLEAVKRKNLHMPTYIYIHYSSISQSVVTTSQSVCLVCALPPRRTRRRYTCPQYCLIHHLILCLTQGIVSFSLPLSISTPLHSIISVPHTHTHTHAKTKVFMFYAFYIRPYWKLNSLSKTNSCRNKMDDQKRGGGAERGNNMRIYSYFFFISYFLAILDRNFWTENFFLSFFLERNSLYFFLKNEMCQEKFSTKRG